MSTKRFSFMKSVLSLMVMLLAVFTLVACGEDEQALVDAAIDSVAITYATGDSASSVTDDLTLITSVGEVTITWASNNPSVVSNTGMVTRPAVDTGVSLTATLTYGEYSRVRSFYVTVKAAEVVIDPLDALDAIFIDYAGTEAADRVTVNVGLPTESLGLPITWSSTNEAVLGTDGKVNRPAYGATDQTVILTATIGDETRDFVIKVLALTEKPATLIVEEAYTALLLSGGISAGVVTGDLELALTVGEFKVPVVWTSSNEDVITKQGYVYRPEEGSADAEITLTAKLSYGGITMYKEFNVTVTARSVSADFTGNISEVFGQTIGTYVRVEGVTVFGIAADGYYIADASGHAFVYGSLPKQFGEGSVVDIEGFTAAYYFALQLSGTTNDPIYVVPSDADETEVAYPEKTIAQIMAMDKPSATNYLHMTPMTITARVLVVDQTNYGTFLVPIDHKGALDKNNAIMIYYKSNLAAVKALAGQKVELEIVLMAYRTNDMVWTAVFLQDAADIEVIPATDAELVEVANEQLGLIFDPEYVVDEEFTLPADINGVSIVWASDSAYFDEATGDLTVPTDMWADVTVTATLTKGDVTDTFSVTFKAGVKPLQTIAVALAQELGALVHVQGVVLADEYYRTYFIQDATGGIAVYTSWSTLQTFLEANIGNEVQIIGTRAQFNGLNQISGTVVYSLVDADAAAVVPVNVDMANLDKDALLPYQGQLVEFTGLIVVDIDDDQYGNAYITLLDADADLTITMKWDSRVALSTEGAALLAGLALNDIVDIVNPLAWNNNPYLYFTSTTIITKQVLTDAEKLALLVSLVPTFFEDKYFEDGTIELPAALIGGTMTYVSTATSFDEATGAVTVPASGNELVTVTVTVTVGTLTQDVTIEFQVGPDAILSLYDYVDGDMVNGFGIVTGIFGTKYVFVAQPDGSAAIMLYYPDVIPAGLAVGDEVVFTGEMAPYRGLIEIADAVIEIVSTGNTVPAAIDLTALPVFAPEDQSIKYDVTGLTVVSVSGQNLVVTDGTRNITVRVDDRNDLDLIAYIGGKLNGQTVELIGVNLGWFDVPQFILLDEAQVVFGAITPELKMANAKLELTAAYEDKIYMEGSTITLATTTTVVGGTVTWAVAPEIINLTTGLVGDVAMDTAVVLTATITVDALTDTLDLNVLVKLLPTLTATDLFISEYIEGSSNNKAIEIYNGTGAAVNLTGYKVVLYSNGSTTPGNTYNLTGTLAPYDTLVIYNSSAVQAIKDVGDVSSSVTFFNGDDAVALFKNDVLIDLFGIPNGTDPGTSWDGTFEDGTYQTHDRTWVRESQIISPNATWDPNEWDVYGVDTLIYLGMHVMD